MLEHPRYRRVLQTVGEKTNWSKKPDKGVGRGIATCERSGAIFAMVIEVQERKNKIVPTKVTMAIDVGICINPDTVKAQAEGSVVMGLGACYSGLTISNGSIVEKNYDKYRMPRIADCPEIITYILDSDAPPDGAGEAGLPTVAPALANAIFNLTGKRIRKLPMT
jgi:isoquinoline 1-oxidoreductase subunit beta